MMLLQRLLFYYLLVKVDASRNFSPNCTVPAEGSRFVGSPSIRGTIDILWSCLLVLFLCTWTVQHLNLPSYVQMNERTWRETCKIGFNRVVRKGYWMIVTLLVPEYIVGLAWRNRLIAKRLQREIGNKEWTRTHAFYALMGGFVLRCQCETDIRLETEERTWRLNVDQILYLYQQNLISWKPVISEDEIDDKSKSDMFAKCTAIVQVSWLLIQVLARHFQEDLSTSQLEIAVLAFAVCTLFTYALMWDKPQDINVPTYLDATQPLCQQQLAKLDRMVLPSGSDDFLAIRTIRAIPAISNNDVTSDPIFLFAGASNILGGKNVGFALSGMIFGAMHCLAWNFSFPTPLECWIWRIAAIISTVLPPLLLTLYQVSHWVGLDPLRKWFTYGVVMAYGSIIAYGVLRLYIIVEMFRSLAFLPPSAFRTVQWTQFLPHVG